jgi:hypothetical protein
LSQHQERGGRLKERRLGTGTTQIRYRRSRLTRSQVVAGLVAFVLLGETPDVRADGVPVGSPGTTGALTHFEAFVLSSCVPCVRESYSIVTIPVASTKAPTFPRSAGVPEGMTRPGQIELGLLRAYPAGQNARQQMAMRVTLSVSTGLQGVQLYPLSAGLIDETDVAGLAAMLAQLASTAGSAKSDAEISDFEVHGDNLRIGIVRTHEQSLLYIQAWSSADLPRLALKQVWEVPSLYLPLSDLPTLQRGVEQVSTRIRQLRAQ